MNITGYLDLDLAIQGPSREPSHDNTFLFVCLVGFFSSLILCPLDRGLPCSNMFSSGQ